MLLIDVRLSAALFASMLLSACAGGIVPQGATPLPPRHVTLEQPATRPVFATPMAPRATTTIAKGPNARSAGVMAGPDLAALSISNENYARALAAFRISCAGLQRRNDNSGLTQAGDWVSACAAATSVGDSDAKSFFLSAFETAQVGAGTGLATGYFIPEITASRTASSQYATPIYRRPADLAEIDLGSFSDSLKGKTIRGRYAANATGGNSFVPFADRAGIVSGALRGQGLEIAYAEDPIAFFFLQIQGSGILRFPDGSTQLIGYASQNGRDYTGVGGYMKARNIIPDGSYSYQNITNYLRTHPTDAPGIMNTNASYVFFRELPDRNVLGAMGVALTDRTSVAADPAYIPLGAPIFLSMDNATANGLWVAQDTGGAIKGANRVDTYWGPGAAAQAIAGGMSARGTMFVLLPRGVLARINSSATSSIKP